jgi:threonine dehydratase
MPPGKYVVTHSSGNHAQAIAFAAKATGRKATIVMPTNAPLPKKKATESYGASIVFCEPADRAVRAQALAVDLNATLVHPSENPDVIAGQGVVALEVIEQVRSKVLLLDTLWCFS